MITTSSMVPSTVFAGLGGLADVLAGLGGLTQGLGGSAGWFVVFISSSSIKVPELEVPDLPGQHQHLGHELRGSSPVQGPSYHQLVYSI